MKKISSSHHSSLSELNITPLLDLAFVLLVIFIITTPQLSNDLEMNLPSPKKPNTPTPPPKINYIVVDQSGHLALNQQPIDLPTLKPTLKQLKTDDPETSVVVRGAADVDYQKVMDVLDALQQSRHYQGRAGDRYSSIAIQRSRLEFVLIHNKYCVATTRDFGGSLAPR